MIFLVTDINEPKGICSDSPWVAKLSIHSALTAKGTDKVSSCVKDLDSVVVSVGYDILSNFIFGPSCVFSFSPEPFLSGVMSVPD